MSLFERWWLLPLVMPAIGLAILSCKPRLAENGEERRECPHDWKWETRIDRQDTLQLVVPSGQLSGPGPISNIPEFHDCQRFLVKRDGELRYDSLFAVFAVERQGLLDSLVALDSLPLRPEEPDTMDRTRETSTPTDAENASQAVALTAGDGVPGAEIVAWGDYDPLKVKRGFNCLYMYLRENRWHAKMVSFDNVEKDCSNPVNPDTIPNDLELAVRWEQPGGIIGREHYPPVARWDWDPQDSLQYIGIRCPLPGPAPIAAWCEVGPTGFQSSPVRHPAPPGGDIRLRRTRLVRGWYDEQWLAAASGGPKPTPIRGTIFPAPDLADLEWPNAGVWDTVAYVMLTGYSEEYKKKFNFEQTAPEGPYNVVELCWGSECVADLPIEEIPKCPQYDPDLCDLDTKQWYARITSPSGDVQHRCIRRCVLLDGIEVPATTRWRWMANDEGNWIRCVHGCCDLIGGD